MQAEIPKISVVIPSFNQGMFIEQTILSILDQNYPNLELMVLDGGSTDNSLDIIKKYETQIFYWRSRKDEGHYSAIQEGFEKSSGNILTWINSDDMLARDSLQIAAEIFSTFPQVDWITGCKSIIKAPANEESISAEGSIWKGNYTSLFSAKHSLDNLFWNPFIQQEGSFWRRDLWTAAGGLQNIQSKWAGDFELWLRFFQKANLYTVNTHLGHFRSTPEQVSQQNFADYVEECLSLISHYQDKVNANPTSTNYYQIRLDKSSIDHQQFLESEQYTISIKQRLLDQDRGDLWETLSSALDSFQTPDLSKISTLHLPSGAKS